MTHLVGTALILASWLYVFVAVKYANGTYEKIATIDPTYFSSPSTLTKSLNWQSSFGVIKLITDQNIGQREYPMTLHKRIKNAKLLYFFVPIAFALFMIGIWIR